MIRRLAPLFSLLVALGCGAPTGVVARFELGEPFALAVGQQAANAEGTVIVRFERVVTDSRCPIGAVCVWAGEAIIEVRVTNLTGNSLAAAKDAAAPLPGARLSMLPPLVALTVGADEPVVAYGLAVRALDLTRRNTDPGANVVPTAQLRVDMVP